MNNLSGPVETPKSQLDVIETPKTADLKNLKVEGVKSESTVVSPSTAPTHFPSKPLTEIRPGLIELPNAAKLMREQINGVGVRAEQAMVMAKALDNYVTKTYPKQVQHALKHALSDAKKEFPSGLTTEQQAAILKKVESQVFKKFTDSIKFFVTVDPRKGPEAPLERMSAPFEYLTPPADADRLTSFNAGMAEYAADLAMRAFDQHLENPEQYVSHGFDHSINVANYTRDVLRLNPEIVTATSNIYKISEGEAKFMLETVALLHDCGYPCVGHRAKSVHGISGADLVLPMKPMFEKMITSPKAKKEILFNDFRNSILFHSADKIEQAFTSKIVSTLGTFLADHKNIVQVLSNFYDPSKNPSGQPRYALEIYVQNEEMKKDIEENLKLAKADLESKLDHPAELPKVTIHNGLFKGRFADLEYNKDKLLGLEFTNTDLLTSPLNMIRLVDNMDMSKTRLTPTQNEEAFREIYLRLGDNNEICKLAVVLEQLERETDEQLRGANQGDRKALMNKVATSTQKAINNQMNAILATPSVDPFIKKVFGRITAKVSELKVPKDARNLLNEALINTIFEEQRFQHLSPEVKEEIRRIGMYQSSIDLRHFGGCEGVLNVKLVGIPVEDEEGKFLPNVVVTVNRSTFNDLNVIKVRESSPTLTGVNQTVIVGVGEYQIWRASDAYRSILLGGMSVKLRIQDESGQEVPSTITPIS